MVYLRWIGYIIYIEPIFLPVAGILKVSRVYIDLIFIPVTGGGVPRGGGQGAMALPKPESQGAILSFGPPHSRYIRFFFQIYIIHYYLLYP